MKIRLEITIDTDHQLAGIPADFVHDLTESTFNIFHDQMRQDWPEDLTEVEVRGSLIASETEF